jgi:hypothetical protein
MLFCVDKPPAYQDHETAELTEAGADVRTTNREEKGTASAASRSMQAKLVVGTGGGPLEHEADRVADQVVRRQRPGVHRGNTTSAGFLGCTPLLDLPPAAAAAHLGTYLLSLLHGLSLQERAGLFHACGLSTDVGGPRTLPRGTTRATRFVARRSRPHCHLRHGELIWLVLATPELLDQARPEPPEFVVPVNCRLNQH